MVDSRPSFSCVIPTHGRPHLLGDAMRSVLSQTDGRQLIGAMAVVIDDNNAESRELVERIAHDNPALNIQAIMSSRDPRGAAQSRNVGVAATTCPYIAFLDDDDLWLPDHLSNAASLLEQAAAGAGAVVSSRRTESWTGEVTDQPVLNAGLVSLDHAFSSGSVVTGSNLIVARNVFEALGGYDVDLPVMNDTDFLVRLLQAGHRPLVSSEVSVVMRNHQGDQLTRPNARRARGMRVFYEKHRSAMTAAQRRSFRYRMLGMHRLSAETSAQRAYYAMLQATNVQPAHLVRRFRGAR